MTNDVKKIDKNYLKLRKFYRSIFGRVTDLLAKEGLSSVVFPFIVFFLSLAFAIFVIMENTMQAGIIAVVMAACDVMGSLVREKQNNPRNELIDNILSKYSEVVFYASAMVFALQVQNTTAVLLVFIAFIGAFMSGFIVTKASGVGIDLDWGVLRRPERMLLIGVGIIFGTYGLLISSAVVALLSNAAAFYFLWYIWFNKNT